MAATIRLRSGFVALALLLGSAPPAQADLCGDGALDILLTNDDGIAAPGIAVLRDDLRGRGHRVTVVAPDYNASGSSTSLSWRDVHATRSPDDPLAFSITGTPATAVVLGATALYPPGTRPDLVVSGINNGDNAGALLAVSGTVGAALAGTVLVDPPIPGIAISAPRRAPGEPVDSATNRAHLAQVADFLVRFVDATRQWFCVGGSVVRARTVLNVNYPALPADRVRGAVVTRQSRATDLRVTYVDTGNGAYSARTDTADVPGYERNADSARLAEGYVTVTAISAALDDESAPGRALSRRLRGLWP